MSTVAYRFLVRGGTAANLAAVNETPLQRELVVERDTGRMKLGDGVTPYNDLPYFGDLSRIPLGSNGDFMQLVDGKPAWITLPRGNLVAGEGVELSGTLTGRLLGSGNVIVTATGGGGGGQTHERPWVKPSVADFDLLRLGTANDGFIEDYDKGVRIRSPGVTSNVNQLYYALRELDGFTGELDLKVRMVRNTPLVAWMAAGIILRSAAGASQTLGIGYDAQLAYLRNAWAGDTAWSSVDRPAQHPDMANVWLRVTLSGGTFRWYGSVDGYWWQLLRQQTISGFVPAYAGIFQNPNTGGAGNTDLQSEVSTSFTSFELDYS